MCPRESRLALALLGCVSVLLMLLSPRHVNSEPINRQYQLPCRVSSSWPDRAVDGKIDVRVLSLKSSVIDKRKSEYHRASMRSHRDVEPSRVQVSDHRYYPGASSLSEQSGSPMSRVTTNGHLTFEIDGSSNNGHFGALVRESLADLRKRRHARRLNSRMMGDRRVVDSVKPMAYVHIQPSSYPIKYGGVAQSRKCVRCMMVYKPCPAADDAHSRRIVLPAPRYQQPAANWRGLKYGECVCAFV